MSSSENGKEAIRSDSWNHALECFGTKFIFDQRAKSYRSAFFWNDILSIGTPFYVGTVVLTFGTAGFALIAAVAGILGLANAVLAIVSLAGGFQDKYQKCMKSVITNQHLSEEYKKLGKSPPADYRKQFELLESLRKRQSEDDLELGVTEEEKRIGMRAALRQFRRSCAGCGKVPVDLKSTDCGVCGQFKRKAK